MAFTDEQIAQLDKPLDARLVSERKGGGNTSLKYIEGHDAIDSANRLFSYGGWSYRPLMCEQTIILDPMTGEAVGIAYKAQVELTVQGCNPIVEVGSQPVASWNVRDTVLGRRKKDDSSDVKEWEAVNARRTIIEAHEMAEKGAVTDALKRALRTFGNQFGNGLYGDGRVDLTETVQPTQPAPRLIAPTKTQAEPQAAAPTPIHATGTPTLATGQQLMSIGKLCEHLGKTVPTNQLSEVEAGELLSQLSLEYRNRRKAS